MSAITSGRNGIGRAWLAGWMALGLLMTAVTLAPDAAKAELRRVEAVGIYGIEESMRTKVIPRDEAIAKARWEGVSRVALELIDDSDSAPTEDVENLDNSHLESDLEGGGEGAIVRPLERGPLELGDANSGDDAGDVRLDSRGTTEGEARLLESALGRDMLPYTRSYRILQDKGEKPVLFDDAPGIETEYVVVIEVIVDVDRVEDALIEAGLVTSSASTGIPGEALTIEILGLSHYQALERAVEALRGPLGATRVSTLEFERSRQVLSIEGPFDLDGLVRWLSGYRDAQLVLEPVAMDPELGRVRVMGRWFPPSEESGGEPQSRVRSRGSSPRS